MAFLNHEQLAKLGLKSYGENVLISDKASIYSPHLITIGSNVRIDDFCLLSGEITLGNFIHIGAFCALYGKYGIEMGNFTGLSPRCTIFSAIDDFSGAYLISPMVAEKYTNVTGGKIQIRMFAQIGAHSIVMPNVTIEEGVAVGAMSLVKENLIAWNIFAGVPVRSIKLRKKNNIELAKAFLNSNKND